MQTASQPSASRAGGAVQFSHTASMRCGSDSLTSPGPVHNPLSGARTGCQRVGSGRAEAHAHDWPVHWHCGPSVAHATDVTTWHGPNGRSG
eukprot:COSAG01_NODE_3162_length_6478_cov_6.251450_3_plen_91_part_00